MSDPPRPPRDRSRLRRGAYLLPSLFTIGNILLGFYAIVRAYRGELQPAALLVIGAAIVDALDGRIARLTGTESAFGREFDSLADVMTFGATPALMAFLWGLHDLGRIGWLVPLYFVVCTATRLARFNVQTDVVDKRFFVGLPSPAAAGAIVSLFFVAPDRGVLTYEEELAMRVVLLVALAVVGSLMVSTFRYPSFKKVDLGKRVSYRALLLAAAFGLVLLFAPKAFFFTAALVYTLMGPLGWLVGRLRRGGSEAATAAATAEHEDEVEDEDEDEDEDEAASPARVAATEPPAHHLRPEDRR